MNSPLPCEVFYGRGEFIGNFCSQLFEDSKQRTEDELMEYRWDKRGIYNTDDLLNKIMSNPNEDKGPEFE